MQGQNSPPMPIKELMEWIDLTAKSCRDRKYRTDVIFNLNKFYPGHAFTEKVIKLHWDIKRDKDFREAARKEVKLLEDSPRTG